MANSTAEDKSSVPLSGPRRRSVVLVLAIVSAVTLALLPISSRPVPPIPGLVAVLDVGLFVTEVSTGFLLLVRFRAVRTWSVLVLGCAYFYSGLMVMLHLLTRPGTVLAAGALIETPSQVTPWIFTLWGNGFVLTSLIAVGLEARFGRQHRVAIENVERAAAFGVGATVFVVLAVFLATLAAADRLPQVVSGQHLTQLGAIGGWLGVIFLATSIAVILLVIGEQNRLFLWLSLVLLTMMFAKVLTAFSLERYTIGWTLARIGWLTSAGVLFVYLLILHARDQHLWTRARELLSGAVENEDGVVLIPATIPVALEAFVARENVTRYTRMLAEQNDETQRQLLRRMLAEEQGRLKQMDKSAR